MKLSRIFHDHGVFLHFQGYGTPGDFLAFPTDGKPIADRLNKHEAYLNTINELKKNL